MVNIMIQWMMTGLVSLLHPFFVSLIEVNHNAKEANVEISVRIFTEDFEKTLQKYTPGKVDMLNPSNPAALDREISIYISQKLHCRIDGKPVALSYVGHEVQKESVWSYFEVPKVSDMKKLEVDCNLLYDFEKAQSNIFHVKVKGVEKSYKLDYPKTSASFEF